ncbi:hypothetical protein [Persicirhabdus sediminis]|uniref:Uncharacterized protein n=1 Tax=Persicirhabdus sediminis TaxID=454144 RepID=A0A8J7SGM6_9BACT|nr:hypothetical protein [Persicirhabdus sediminis]MBK1790200.1 hypothetical protein [Persicirhabdus sediminis]
MNADSEKKIVDGVLEHFKFPDDWVVKAESSYYDSVETKVVVRRSLLLDITKLIPEGIDRPGIRDSSVESRRFYAGLARRFRDDVCDGLSHLTSHEFDSMNLDQRPNASPSTAVFYNQDCVVTVISEFEEVRDDHVLWSIDFAAAFDAPTTQKSKSGEQGGGGQAATRSESK